MISIKRKTFHSDKRVEHTTQSSKIKKEEKKFENGIKQKHDYIFGDFINIVNDRELSTCK